MGTDAAEALVRDFPSVGSCVLERFPVLLGPSKHPAQAERLPQMLHEPPRTDGLADAVRLSEWMLSQQLPPGENSKCKILVLIITIALSAVGTVSA